MLRANWTRFYNTTTKNEIHDVLGGKSQPTYKLYIDTRNRDGGDRPEEGVVGQDSEPGLEKKDSGASKFPEEEKAVEVLET